ncbi:MAG: MarR family winged helix-turn-helix transcriptional regulator [Succinivibrio sp.]|jgi:DNA-binding MarR family transcriptional regulator|nr:MarR family winged helix-turn-helix transcriptional regulator [Succinivibrio sp.]
MSKAAVLELCSKVYKAQRDYLQTRLKERIPEGIELCHVEIFNELRKTPGIGINELAKRCGRVKSTVSVMCERLCKLGYLEKRPEGKGARAFGLWLTQSAAEVLKSADAAGAELAERSCDGLSKKERKHLEDLLMRIAGNLTGVAD